MTQIDAGFTGESVRFGEKLPYWQQALMRPRYPLRAGRGVRFFVFGSESRQTEIGQSRMLRCLDQRGQFGMGVVRERIDDRQPPRHETMLHVL